MSLPFRAAILDLDGTLIDSMSIWHEIDVQFFTENGLAVPEGISETVAKMSTFPTASAQRPTAAPRRPCSRGSGSPIGCSSS